MKTTLISLAALLGTFAFAAPAAPAMPTPKADVYEVHRVAELPLSLEYPAKTQSKRFASVVARVEGVLLSQHFSEGAHVKAGDLLYRIEPDLYAAKVREAEANVAVAQALYDNATREWDRAQKLQADQAISQRDYDAALSGFERAKAELGAVQARLSTAQIDLGYTEVRAPIAGVALSKLVDTGNMVSPGTALVQIAQNNPIDAAFSIPQSDMAKLGGAKKLKAALHVGFERLEGEVDFLSSIVDNKTASVQARATFANPEGRILSGSFGRIVLEAPARKDLLMVPQKAILQNPQGTIVFIVEEGKVGVRPVTLGESEGELFIVKGPLREGDRVIVNNFFRLKPGAPVEVDRVINAKAE
ncbi:MAG: efflux RND transporter periplasmic adaptor subunit [Campylobacterales bacterium]|nr:efflux RND transporter periplasmic adaptor subunit [Campylobacterales bacterium]